MKRCKNSVVIVFTEKMLEAMPVGAFGYDGGLI